MANAVVERAFKAKGFTLENTGGGIMIFIRDDLTKGEVLVSALDGSGPPEALNEPVMVGFYGVQHDESLLVLRFPSAKSFLDSVLE